jgi:oligopeptide transport system substrate-binding protein
MNRSIFEEGREGPPSSLHRSTPLRTFAIFCKILLSVFAGWLVASCSKPESAVARGNREGVLHFSIGSEPSDLDPHTVVALADSKVMGALFEPLVTYEPGTLEPRPALAESWEISADGLAYTFHLRADAKWSNGEPVIAQDCVDSWRRVLTPTLTAPYADWFYLLRGAEAFHKGQTKDFSTVGVVATDARTLVVTLKHPAPYFLQVLLNSPWRPVNVRSIAAFGDAYRRGTPWTNPGRLVSSGPFVLKEWNAHQHILVEKSPTYWDRAHVRLNAIRFYPIDSIGAEEQAFRAGQLHVTWSLLLSKVLPLQRENSPALRIDPTLQTYFFRLNTRRPPFDDSRVRRALSLSINREAIASKVLSGGRQPAASFVPPFLKGSTPPVHTAYDLAAARQLLADSGHAGGRGLPPIEVLYNNNEILRVVAEAIQQMWHRDLGVDVQLVNQEYKVVMANRRTGDFQILLGDWTADYLDATTFLDLWRKDNGNNYTGWSDPAYDALAAKADATIDPAARAAILAQEESLVLEAAPIIPIYFNTHVYLLHPAVKGWQPTPMDHIEFRYVSLQP